MLKNIHNDSKEISKLFENSLAPQWFAYIFYFIFLLGCTIKEKIKSWFKECRG